MQEETLTTLKDILIPGLSIIVAGGSVYLSHRQMRLQIKKNMRVQHIDRIRDEVSEFVGRIIMIDKTKSQTSPVDYFQEDIIKNMSRLMLLLDTKKPLQNKLGNEIKSVFKSVVKNRKSRSTIDSVISAAHAAIKELEDEI